MSPSTVGTSTNTDATQEPFQRKSFYANGRFWVFYSNGTNMVWRTSTDGTTWGTSTTIRASTVGDNFSFWFDGKYVHYAYASGTINVALNYRRGTPNANGTITWSDLQIAVAAGASNRYYNPSISVDDSGYPWIGYLQYDAFHYYPFVTKSSTNEGTWTTDTGFPYQLSTTSQTWRISVVPLTVGNMYVIYASGGATIRGRLWNGSDWGDEEASTSAFNGVYQLSTVGDSNDNVYLVFSEYSSYDILFMKRTYADGWGTEVTVIADTTTTTSPMLSISGTELYCFWATKTTDKPTGATANHIYYQKSIDGGATWSAMVDWIDESADVLYNANTLTCFYKNYSDYMGLVYMTATASPYNIRFSFSNFSSDLQVHFIIRKSSSSDLQAHFSIRRSSSSDLQSGFYVLTTKTGTPQDLQAHFNSQSTADLKAQFFVLLDSENLQAHLLVRHSDSSNLQSHFKTQSTINLQAHLIVRHIGASSLQSHLIVRHSGSAELKTHFIAQPIAELKAEFTIRRTALIVPNLKAKMWLIRTWSETKGVFKVRQSASSDILGTFIVALQSSEDLKGELIVKQGSSRGLQAKFIIRTSNSSDLQSHFTIRTLDASVLQAHFIIRPSNLAELLAHVFVRNLSSSDLQAHLIPRRSSSSDLQAHFIVWNLDASDLQTHVILRRSLSNDLQSGFKVRQEAGNKPIYDYSLDNWLNFVEGVGSGFIDSPSITVDPTEEIFGIPSTKIESIFSIHKYEMIRFGWTSEPSNCYEVVEPAPPPPDTGDLKAKFWVRNPYDSSDVKAKFWVRKKYDFSNAVGIAFYWWGSGVTEGHQLNEVQMWSPTGGWIGYFADGPSEWRWILMPFEDRDPVNSQRLIEVDIGESRADKSQMEEILWAYFTHGLRRLGMAYIWYGLDLKSYFVVRRSSSAELQCHFIIGP